MPKKFNTCLKCGEYPISAKNKYCKPCAIKVRKSITDARNALKIKRHICPTCNNEFKGSTSVVYCSKECKKNRPRKESIRERTGKTQAQIVEEFKKADKLKMEYKRQLELAKQAMDNYRRNTGLVQSEHAWLK